MLRQLFRLCEILGLAFAALFFLISDGTVSSQLIPSLLDDIAPSEKRAAVLLGVSNNLKDMLLARMLFDIITEYIL